MERSDTAQLSFEQAWGEIGWEFYRRMFRAALRGGKMLREYGGYL